MTVSTNAGNKFYVSTTATPPATYDAAGYGALTYDEVGEITDLGTLSAEYAVTEHNPIGDRNLQKLKGTRDNGSQDLTLGFDTVDAGQVVVSRNQPLSSRRNNRSAQGKDFVLICPQGLEIVFSVQIQKRPHGVDRFSLQVLCLVKIELF